ncbi:uncharacterized protein LOC113519852 [Galleria mellonella]|uniref:Uncharacterized protein LOC113519852 n=1 Tax=Galleria mellonella TaxID=7137 RepID=A0ABM3MZE2_GALME|nr:uncharacterized protein LOC113519852 [Galleria mellonella]
MNSKFFVTFAFFLTNFKLCQSKRYDNFTLFGVTPIEVDHLKFLQNLEKKKYIDMIFWRRPIKLYYDVQFIVNPTDKDLFKERAAHFRMKAEMLIPDIQQAFDKQTIQRYQRLKVESFSFNFYHYLEDIYQWLTDIALKFPNITELFNIGKSAEGREIYVLEIKRPGANGTAIVEGGIHGNEWISIEFVTYLAHQLVYSNETGNGRLSDVAYKYNWFLIPIVNPDGYDFTQKVDRLWKKNRRNVVGVFGVDLNRNFDYSFGTYSASNSPNDEGYCGTSPFSEPETKALADFITAKKENLKFYFSIHGYGQKIVIPYSDRIKHVDNYNELENYGKQAIVKMYKLFGTKYDVGTFYDTLGLRLSGNSASWVKKTFNVKHVFTLLLRDNGTYGYALPPEQILPTCKEAVVGMVELMTARPKRVRANLFNSATVDEVSSNLLFILLGLSNNVFSKSPILISMKMMILRLTLILIMILLQTKKCLSKKYDNYTLYRAIPVDERHLNFFTNLSETYNVNFWRNPGLVYRPVEFIIAPEDIKAFSREVNASGIYLTTIIPDVQRAFDTQIVKPYIRRNTESFDWQGFYRLNDIYNWLIDLSKLYPAEVQLQSIGRTYENRDILTVRIVLKGSKMRSRVIIEGGIHAREWISPAFVTYLINEIIHSPYSNNEELKNIAMTYEWYFIPVVNPDGYEYSHREDRLWRKNRHNGLAGVDLNRNFGTAFGTIGVSLNKKSDIYCGSSAFSEKETQAVSNFIRSKSENLEYYIGFHSYGQYMIIPYAHMRNHVGNFEEVKLMGEEAARKIYQKYGTTYTVGTAYDTVGYMTSGVSGCWVKETFDVPYVITFELRDDGQEGFALSPNQIIPTCTETMDGVISLLKPRTNKYTKLYISQSRSTKHKLLKIVVLLWNFLLFIILNCY